MPALCDCKNCGKPSWNLEPNSAAKVICKCDVWLIDGKICPHCKKPAAHAVSDDVYRKHQKEKEEGMWW
jgi:hypothetical protein